MTEISLQIGLDVLRSYRRLAYTPWHALAEFIDNSTQSYLDNRKALDRAYKASSSQLTVTITYDRGAGVLVVNDNAMGMSFEDLQGAVLVGKAPANTSGRSEFGLGMKTAAGWFSDVWSVRTKKLGESVGHRIIVNVAKVAAGQSILPYEPFEAQPEEHFTEIRMEKLHQVLHGRRLGKTKDFLRSMYRLDTGSRLLTLFWEKEPLTWDAGVSLLEEAPNKPWRRAVDFKVGKHRISGWVGVLAPGFSGRSNAGFAMIRRGRLIQGWPEPWRPEAIFGPFEGSNDLINQRVTGEFHFDDFEVTHTKDDILFEEDEEDLVQDGIKSRIGEIITTARTFRHAPPPVEPRSQRLAFEAAIASSGLDVRATSIKRSLDAVLEKRTPTEVLTAALGAFGSRVSKEPSVLTVELAKDTTLRVVVTETLPVDAPYALVQPLSPKVWLLAINAAHPICNVTDGQAAMHFEHLLADSAALWALGQHRREMVPAVWVLLKEAILRGIVEDE